MESFRSRSRDMEDRISSIQFTLEETNGIVKDLQAKITNPQSSVRSAASRRKQNLRSCQAHIRKVIQLLSDRSDNPLEMSLESYEDDSVQRARNRVVREVMMNNKDHAWANVETLNESFFQVWKNRRDDFHREVSGKKENHRTNNRRNKRRLNKLNSRKKALDKSKKSEEWKIRATSVLTRECTSPDVSDEEITTKKMTTPLVWESTQLTNIKEHLDVILEKTKDDHPAEFCRIPPSSIVPDWAIRPKYKHHRVILPSSPSSLPSSLPSFSPSSPLATPSSSSSFSPSSPLATPSSSSFSPSSSPLATPPSSFSPSSSPLATPPSSFSPSSSPLATPPSSSPSPSPSSLATELTTPVSRRQSATPLPSAKRRRSF